MLPRKTVYMIFISLECIYVASIKTIVANVGMCCIDHHTPGRIMLPRLTIMSILGTKITRDL